LRRLADAVEFARGIGELRRDDEARQLWHQEYPRLSEGLPGLLGTTVARAEAQVMRLACAYALLDLSAVVRREPLEPLPPHFVTCSAAFPRPQRPKGAGRRGCKPIPVRKKRRKCPAESIKPLPS